MQRTPDQNTVPNACCQVSPMVPTTAKAKKPFISRPGASAKGRRAHSPMTIVDTPEAITVANSTALTSMPVWLRIAGLTTKI